MEANNKDGNTERNRQDGSKDVQDNRQKIISSDKDTNSGTLRKELISKNVQDNRQRVIRSDKTTAQYLYREEALKIEGTVLENSNERGYTHWWYQRYIEVRQKIHYQHRIWMHPTLIIRSVDLSLLKLSDFLTCLYYAYIIMEQLNQRTGKSIEEKSGVFEQSRFSGVEIDKFFQGIRATK